jgi:hypothetical protein
MKQAASLIESETDATAKALLLAALVSEEFRARGFEPVIVGGSAIEFYTDGAYMSGDVDVCFAGAKIPTPFDVAGVMGTLPCVEHPGIRTWKAFDIYLDVMRELNRHGDTPNVALRTPLGQVVVLSVEEVLVERVFSARCWTGMNAHDEDCAKKLMIAILRGHISCNWEAAARIAEGPAYGCAEELAKMRAEVEAKLASGAD